MKIQKAYTTSKNLIKQYGHKGFVKAVLNKLKGRALLEGIEGSSVNQMSESVTIDNRRRFFFQNALSVWKKQQHELTIEEQRKKIEEFENVFLISVVMPVYNPPLKWLKLAVESLQNQSYRNWELIAVDDGSRDKRGVALLKKMSEEDLRIRVIETEKNGGISKASNLAVSYAKGEFIALMDQDDALSPDAFFWVAKAINQHPQADCFYSDECKIEAKSNIEPCDFIIKPDWSPEFLYNSMYTGHLSFYRKEMVEQIGGFRSEYDFSQDYDLALRMAEHTDTFIHVERILYYWRMIPTSGAAGGKDFARISNLKALADAFVRKGIEGKAEMYSKANRFRVILKSNPLVSIVIPSDSTSMLHKCIDKLVGEGTAYQNIEVIVVANSKTCDEVGEIYDYVSCVRTCRYDKLYNFSDKCNEGVKMAQGEYVIIYNDDVYPTSSNWIEGMLEIMQYPGVGGVSPMTVYENGTIQYAGMITGVPNLIGTAFNGIPETMIESEAMNHFLLRDVSVLCGACMMMRTELYRKVGGFDAIHTPTGHSDVDLSFKIIEKGMRCVYTPSVKLIHIGNHSWANKKTADKSSIFCLKRWGKYSAYDPYFTNTMKAVFYQDVVHQFKIYMPEKEMKNLTGRDILFVTHELTRSGAPIVLKNAVQYSLKHGDWPVVASPVDGPLRQDFLAMGVPVIIDEAIVNGHWSFEHFARNFDLIVVNTIAVSNAIRALSNSLPPVIWWIHEGEVAFDIFKGILPNKIGKNIHAYAVSAYTQNVMETNHIRATGRLMFGVCDCKKTEANEKEKLKQFIMVGTVENRKGQDIAIQAFKLLPKEEQKKSKLLIVGRCADESIRNYIRQESEKNDWIEYLDAMPFEEVLKKYAQSCALLVPSRDDPVPTTAVEAMSLSLPCIVSDHTGISSYITDGENGYVFPIDNINVMADRMLEILQNPKRAEQIGKNGRKIYEKNFTLEKFEKNFGMIVDQSISENKERLALKA